MENLKRIGLGLDHCVQLFFLTKNDFILQDLFFYLARNWNYGIEFLNHFVEFLEYIRDIRKFLEFMYYRVIQFEL